MRGSQENILYSKSVKRKNAVSVPTQDASSEKAKKEISNLCYLKEMIEFYLSEVGFEDSNQIIYHHETEIFFERRLSHDPKFAKQAIATCKKKLKKHQVLNTGGALYSSIRGIELSFNEWLTEIDEEIKTKEAQVA